MFTTGSKFLLGWCAAGLLAAAVYAGASSDRMSLLLVGVALASLLLGLFLVGRPTGAAIGVATAPASADRPLAPTAWPALAALSVAVVAVGLVGEAPVVVAGVLGLVFATGGWFLDTWKAHRDQALPSAVWAQERVVWPAGLPVLAFAGVAVLVGVVSQILLAVDKDVATAIAFVVSAIALGVGAVIALRPRVSGAALSGILGGVAVLTVAGGVVASSAGEREFHAHAKSVADEVASGTAFVEKELEVVAEAGRAVIRFRNEDADILHNISVFTDESATEAVFHGEAINGVGRRTYTFGVEPGEYFYRCEFHIEQMTGTLVVEREAAEEDHGGDEDHGDEGSDEAGSH